MKYRISMTDEGKVLLMPTEEGGGSGQGAIVVGPWEWYHGYRFRRLRKLAGAVVDLDIGPPDTESDNDMRTVKQ